jgi:hypothetical protein
MWNIFAALKEECRLRVFGYRVLGKIFDPVRVGGEGGTYEAL